MARRVGIASLIATLPILVAPAAVAKVIRDFDVGAWQVIAVANDQTNAFSYCMANGSNRDGISVRFTITGSLKWAIGIEKPGWRLARGKSYDIGLTIDRLKPLTGTASALTASHVLAPLASRDDLFDSFRDGRQLKISIVGETHVFDLSEAGPMLQELLSCARLEGKPAVAGNASEKGAKPAAPQPADPASDQLHAEAATVAAKVLARAGIQGFSMMTSAGAAALGSHAAWSFGTAVGTALVMLGETDALLKEMPGSAIGRAADACRGIFHSSTGPTRTKDRLARVSTTCRLTEKIVVATDYLTTPRKAGGVYVFRTITTSIGSESSGDGMNESIRNAVLDLAN